MYFIIMFLCKRLVVCRVVIDLCQKAFAPMFGNFCHQLLMWIEQNLFMFMIFDTLESPE